MVWNPSVYSLLGFGAATICLVAALQIWRHRDERGARPLLVLILALGAWSLLYAVQLGFTTELDQDRWQRLALAVGGTIPAILVVFTLAYTGRDGWLTRSRMAALGAEPLLFGLLALTNPWHLLVWDGATIASTAGGPVLSLSLGVGYYVHIVYAYLLIAIALAVLVAVVTRTSPIYRTQTVALILAAIPPFAANVAFTTRLSAGPLPALDPTPFAFAITGALLTLGLFRFDLLERTPIARRRFLDEMGDGLVVLDDDGRVVEANAIARQAFDPAPVVGRSFVDRDVDGGTGGARLTETESDEKRRTGATRAETEDAHGEHGETTSGEVEAALADLDGRTITATVDGRERTYDLDWTALHGHHDESIGHAIGLRDVTDRNRYEQRLEVVQRVLRHNLRNDMNVIRGWADQVEASAVGDEESVAAEHIIETADGLVHLSEKAQTMIRLGEAAGADRKPVDVGTRLTELVEEFRREYPAATIEYEAPAAAPATSLPDPEFLDVPVRNLVQNAIEHNDAGEPWVRVSVASTVDELAIRVEDDAVDIPAMERDALDAGREDPLRHGSGVGLWLTYWTVSAVGGDVSFDERTPRGNVVTLTLPVRGSRSPKRGVAD